MRTSSPGTAAKLLLLAAALTAATACGSQPPDSQDTVTTSPSAGPGAAGVTELTITLAKAPGAEEETWTLKCDPPGGTHPKPAAACAQLAASGPKAFEPTPPGTACTELYGGPEQGTVTGTYQGKPVDASYARKNGCDIDRWELVSELFGELPKVR
ncbi:subtilase-type protease inhibitor [Actinocorallia sp. API 0066]|uniref:SSI family serine proteinase inhibitor n=1 Tax=Actinocorallia sp. API 0066 TaxID=2896846 RepID=UPI001E505B01|nr:SSI family serine proteinase inhibitor [Actinocorallia sp. API 0066]MCD0452506.1 subtilase-type protease inhibitor [Actinocorallia sp. API 0066]